MSDTESDGEQMGESGSLGAKFDYATEWSLKRTKSLKTNGNEVSTQSCKFEGSASQVASANIDFFTGSYELFSTNSKVSTEPSSNMSHTAKWRDLEAGEDRYLAPRTLAKNFNPADEVVPRGTPLPIYLAADDWTYWIVIAEFPVKITFGYSASAGLIFNFAARGGDNCSDTTLKSATNFRLLTTAEPWVRADAFADASLTYPGVASAGVRLDLLLLKLSLPMGVDVSNLNGDSWSFRVGGRINIEMLSGMLSAYVSVGAFPLEATFWAKLMEWDGFHDSFPLWGMERAIPSAGIRAVLAKFPDISNVACMDRTNNAACSNLASVTNPSKTAPATGDYKTLNPNDTDPNKARDWWLCRFNEADRSKLTKYKDACKDFTRP